jgi:hypothetical protein
VADQITPVSWLFKTRSIWFCPPKAWLTFPAAAWSWADPSPVKDGFRHQHEGNDSKNSFVAEVDPEDLHNSRKQQDESDACNSEENWREHVVPQPSVLDSLPHFQTRDSYQRLPEAVQSTSR